MSKFINETVQDMRGGRDSWRVIIFLSAPSFVVSVAAALAHAF